MKFSKKSSFGSESFDFLESTPSLVYVLSSAYVLSEISSEEECFIFGFSLEKVAAAFIMTFACSWWTCSAKLKKVKNCKFFFLINSVINYITLEENIISFKN